MPLDSASTFGGVGGEILNQSVPRQRADAREGPSTPASSLLQKAAENTIGSHNYLERCQRKGYGLVDSSPATPPANRGALAMDNDETVIHRAPLCPQGPQPLIIIKMKTTEESIQAWERRKSM